MHFELNCGQYVLHDDDGRPIGPLLDELAVCLDRESGTRHKFGDPEGVRAWHQKSQAAFRESGFDDMADNLVVIQGRFTLEDINKVIDCTGYTATLYRKVMDGTADTLDMFGKVIRPAIPAA